MCRQTAITTTRSVATGRTSHETAQRGGSGPPTSLEREIPRIPKRVSPGRGECVCPVFWSGEVRPHRRGWKERAMVPEWLALGNGVGLASGSKRADGTSWRIDAVRRIPHRKFRGMVGWGCGSVSGHCAPTASAATIVLFLFAIPFVRRPGGKVIREPYYGGDAGLRRRT